MTTMQRVWSPDTKQYEMTYVLPSNAAAVTPAGPAGLPGDTGPGLSVPLLTTTARDALGASLYRGLTIFNTTTGGIEVYYGATTLWQPPWNLPWGRIARSTASGSVTTSLTTFSTLNVTFLAGRYYTVRAHWNLSYTGGTAPSVGAELFDGVSVLAGNVALVSAVGFAFNVVTTIDQVAIEQTGGGARSFTMQGRTDAGSCSLVAPSWITVEDVGPNGSAPAS